jgi:hypothetical protein
MKPMSEALMELAARVKKLEDLAAATGERNREKLEARRQEIEATFDREAKKVQAVATEAGTKAQRWWADTKGSVDRLIEAMRADFGELKAEIEADKAQLVAEEAEADAAASIEIAIYWVEVAEYAAVQAALARAEADSLVAQK